MPEFFSHLMRAMAMGRDALERNHRLSDSLPMLDILQVQEEEIVAFSDRSQLVSVRIEGMPGEYVGKSHNSLYFQATREPIWYTFAARGLLLAEDTMTRSSPYLHLPVAYYRGRQGQLVSVFPRLGPLADLDKLVRKSSTAPLQIIVDAAAGLECLHRAGYGHRDVKLSNTFITKEGRGQLGDFEMLSFAHCGDHAADATRTLVERSAAVATLKCLPPEVITQQKTIDEISAQRLDHYALALIIREAALSERLDVDLAGGGQRLQERIEQYWRMDEYEQPQKKALRMISYRLASQSHGYASTTELLESLTEVIQGRGSSILNDDPHVIAWESRKGEEAARKAQALATQRRKRRTILYGTCVLGASVATISTAAYIKQRQDYKNSVEGSSRLAANLERESIEQFVKAWSDKQKTSIQREYYPQLRKSDDKDFPAGNFENQGMQYWDGTTFQAGAFLELLTAMSALTNDAQFVQYARIYTAALRFDISAENRKLSDMNVPAIARFQSVLEMKSELDATAYQKALFAAALCVRQYSRKHHLFLGLDPVESYPVIIANYQEYMQVPFLSTIVHSPDLDIILGAQQPLPEVSTPLDMRAIACRELFDMLADTTVFDLLVRQDGKVFYGAPIDSAGRLSWDPRTKIRKVGHIMRSNGDPGYGADDDMLTTLSRDDACILYGLAVRKSTLDSLLDGRIPVALSMLQSELGSRMGSFQSYLQQRSRTLEGIALRIAASHDAWRRLPQEYSFLSPVKMPDGQLSRNMDQEMHAAALYLLSFSLLGWKDRAKQFLSEICSTAAFLPDDKPGLFARCRAERRETIGSTVGSEAYFAKALGEMRKKGWI